MNSHLAGGWIYHLEGRDKKPEPCVDKSLPLKAWLSSFARPTKNMAQALSLTGRQGEDTQTSRSDNSQNVIWIRLILMKWAYA
jgi:hypothetical protein